MLQHVDSRSVVPAAERRTSQPRAAPRRPRGAGRKKRVLAPPGALIGLARAIALQLVSRTVPGDRVCVLLPAGTDYVAAYLGCAYAGVVAMPDLPAACDAGVRAVVARGATAIDTARARGASVPSTVIDLARLGERSGGTMLQRPTVADDAQVLARVLLESALDVGPSGGEPAREVPHFAEAACSFTASMRSSSWKL